jgi:SAM-dependent methyltransferase
MYGAIALVAAALGAFARAAPLACDLESAYQCIRIRSDIDPDGRPVRILELDGLPHAHVDLADSLALVHDYLLPAAELTAAQAHRRAAPPRVLVIGGGGYSLPRHILTAYPGASVDVIELDPAVTQVARARLGLVDHPDLAIHHGDARTVLAELPDGRKYDLVVLDAFSDIVVPFQLTTVEFDRAVAGRLAPGGRFAALVHDRGDGPLLRAVTRTFAAVFPGVDLLAAGPGTNWDQAWPRTWTVLGGEAPLNADWSVGVTRPTRRGPFPLRSEVSPFDPVPDTGGPVLTDDRAPVEGLAAPLFR